MLFDVLKANAEGAHVEQAAADISSILAGEKKKKPKKLDANKMAALALIFNPVHAPPLPLSPRSALPRADPRPARRQKMAVSASHSAATGHWAKTDQLVEKAIPGACACCAARHLPCGLLLHHTFPSFFLRLFLRRDDRPRSGCVTGQHFKPTFHGP